MLQALRFLEGRWRERERRWDEAERLYEQAVTGSFARIASWHYRLGFVRFKQKRWREAEVALRNAVALSPDQVRWRCRLGLTLERQGQFEEASSVYDQALAVGSSEAFLHAARASCLSGQQRWLEAEAAVRLAIESDSSDASLFGELADALRNQNKRWQEADALERAAQLEPKNGNWYYRLGSVQESIGRLDQAIAAYRQAAKLEPTNPLWLFRLGNALKQAGHTSEARGAFQRVVEADSKLNSKRFGVGVFYQVRGEWPEAAAAFAETAQESPGDSELLFRLGMARDRCYEWQAAADAYAVAVALSPENPAWHYRLGFVLERQQDWEAAAEAYSMAVRQKPDMPYWFYRLGTVLYSSQEYRAACEAFLAMESDANAEPLENPTSAVLSLPTSDDGSRAPARAPWVTRYLNKLFALRQALLKNSSTKAECHYLLGLDYERDGDPKSAAAAYRAASLRSDTHESRYFYRLGASLVTLEQHREACEAFVQTRILATPAGVPETPLKNDVGVRRRVVYTEFYQGLRIQENLAFYESYLGASMSGNPLAIFAEILGREEFHSWNHVWAVNELRQVPVEYRALPNVWFVTRDSDGYLRSLATAKLLVNNVSFPDYFIRKRGQLYLNTWHGTPIKYLGKDIKEETLSHKNVARNFLHATHIISPNPHTTNVLLERYDVSGIVPGIVAETGYPRIDATLNATAERKSALRRLCGITGPGDRVVLYAPTWRGTHGGNVSVDLGRLERDVRAMKSQGTVLLFRGHHMAEKYLASSSLGDCAVPVSIDTNELLSIVDVLITDYSSIATDFLVTGRPIIYYTYDLAEYKEARGLYFPLSELPGRICSTIAEVSKAIRDAIDPNTVYSNDLSYREAKQRFCPADDGQVARRVVDLVLKGKTEGVVVRPIDTRTSLLFYVGPLLPSGILSSWKNLVSALDSNRFITTLVVDPESIVADPERQREFDAIPPHVRILGRTGTHCATLEERWIASKLQAQDSLPSKEMMERHAIMQEREFVRIFGGARFDCVIHFEGYNHQWVSILAAAPNRIARRGIYLHNDMLNEWRRKFPYLKQVFQHYASFDLLASVSKSTSELNRNNLATLFNLSPSKFDYCENLQDSARILQMSRLPIQDLKHQSLLSDPGPKFITLGRLSPEKSHAKLINAFARVAAERTSARLLILGDGPLRESLKDQIETAGLTKQVYLLGHIANPFPYLAQADCFILSSDYEGQPTMLFEAMILRKAIVATRIVGTQGVLEGRPGLLVDNSEQGLVDGMLKFLREEIDTGTFNYQEYQDSALSQFLTKVVGKRAS